MYQFVQDIIIISWCVRIDLDNNGHCNLIVSNSHFVKVIALFTVTLSSKFSGENSKSFMGPERAWQNKSFLN